MGGEIVHDDNVALRERGNEAPFHPFFEEGCVDRAIEDLWRDEAAKADAADQRDRLVMAVRHGGAQPSSAPASSAFARQIGRGAGFIDEDELRRVEIGLSLEPFEAALQHVRPLLFGGMRALFLNVTRCRSKKRHKTELEKCCEPACNFHPVERGIGLQI